MRHKFGIVIPHGSPWLDAKFVTFDPNLVPRVSLPSLRLGWGDKRPGNEVALTLRLVRATLRSGKVERREVIPKL